MYEILLTNVEWPHRIEEGKLNIVAEPGSDWPYVTVVNNGEIVFFAWFDRIVWIKKVEPVVGRKE